MNERQRGGRDAGGAGDAWLHATVRAALPESTGSCPDASEVAAFAEGRLDPAERERFEQHVASCSRCLDLLGTLALVNDPGASAAEERGGERATWWRWLVPATVAATAAGLYLLVQPAPPATPTRTAEPPAQAVVADSRVGERAGQGPGGAATREAEPLEKFGATSVRPQAPPAAASEPSTPPPAKAAPARARAKGAEPARPVSAEAAAQVATPVERDLAGAEPGAVVPDEPRAVPHAEAAAPRAASIDNRALGATAAAHWLEVPVPGGTSRWRFGPGTAVSRSSDGGRTWEPGTTPAGVTAASCPARFTCWAVGRSGVVIVTSDGVTWRRVSFPDTSDLGDVSAEDGMVATVTTVSGLRYTTKDGGATWVAESR